MTTRNRQKQRQQQLIITAEKKEQENHQLASSTIGVVRQAASGGPPITSTSPQLLLNDNSSSTIISHNNNNNNNKTSCQACLSIVAEDREKRRKRRKNDDSSRLSFSSSSSENDNTGTTDELDLSKDTELEPLYHRHRRRRLLIITVPVLLLLVNFVFILIILSVPAALTSPIYSSSHDNNNNDRSSSIHNDKNSNSPFSSSSSSSSFVNYTKHFAKKKAAASRTRSKRQSMPGSAGTVATNLGLVQGRLVQLPNTNIEVYEFLGVPYAEPPIGERRFRKPIPKQPWKDIFDATSRPNSCPQLLDTLFDTFDGATMWNANTEMSEDCLYLNIWVPRRVLDDLSRSRLQNGGSESGSGGQRGLHPVFIWIFGGGFTSGTTTLDCYDGRIIAGYNNIIVASMQYRLGALGFLYFGVDDAPGNMGLWDQLLALKWLCENIHNFGGDCRNTTIFGESAGAASVSLHLLSPYSREYFQRAIMESASALSGWAVITQEEASWRANELVTKFASTCAPPPSASTAGDSESIFSGGAAQTPPPAKSVFDETRWKIDCLRSQQFLRLPEEEWGVLASDPAGYAQFPFVAVIDGDFLPRHPRDLLADGQYYNISILTGLNKNEGSYFMLYTTKGYQLFKHPRAPNKQMNFTTRVYSELIRDFFAYYPHFNRSTSQIALDAIEFQYTPWRLPVITSQDIISAVDAATGDWAFACPVVSWADSYVELPPSPMATPSGRMVDYYANGGGGNGGGGPSQSALISSLTDSSSSPLSSSSSSASSSSVRYVRLKRSFASGFSYLQQPTGNNEPNNNQAGGGGTGTTGGTSGGPVPLSAMRNPDSIYSSIPETDLWYSKHKVFLYYFTQRSSQNNWPAWMGVLHADEINFVFGEPFNYSKSYTDEEKMLSRLMMAYWCNFAKFGDPNIRDRSSPNQVNLDLPPWPEYSYYEKTFLELSVDTLVTKRQPSVGTSIKAQECAFWHGYLPKLDALSAEIDRVEYDWRKSFNHWKYNLLPEWEAQFRSFKAATSLSSSTNPGDWMSNNYNANSKLCSSTNKNWRSSGDGDL